LYHRVQLDELLVHGVLDVLLRALGRQAQSQVHRCGCLGPVVDEVGEVEGRAVGQVDALVVLSQLGEEMSGIDRVLHVLRGQSFAEVC
jgi:hypothetical protein